jgi:GTP cyclohydrolase IA
MLMKADPSSQLTPAEPGEGVPMSVKIRERVEAARKRFHSNDNIAAFIQPGELEVLLDEVTVKMQGVLDSMVIDTSNDHNTGDTARRVAKMYLNEVFRGRYVPPPTITEFPNAEHLNELMIVGPITVRSACSHHLCPVIGKLWIGVMPNEHTNVIGLSKYARLAEWIMGRPQIQEEAVVQLADLIMEKTQPDGLALVMEAKHYCMAWRGVKDLDSKMINSVMRGAFLKDAALRREFLALIPHKD